MDDPCTTATCGIPAADIRAWFAKLRPPSTKISAWYIRFAPPDSTSATSGSLFSSAMACARRAFFRPIGAMVPPLTALSLAEITTRLPDTVPIPTIEPPPCTLFLPSSSCMASPASGLNSRKSLPRSSRRDTRSRGSNCPRSSNRLRFDSDSVTTFASSARTSSSRACMRSEAALNAALFVSSPEAMTGITSAPPGAPSGGTLRTAPSGHGRGLETPGCRATRRRRSAA